MRPLSLALILEKPSFHSQLVEALKGIPVRIVLDQGGFHAWEPVREKIERLQPDVLLVDLGEQPDQRFSCIRMARALAHPPAVVVIHGSSEASAILSAMRAGAAEFLTVPIEAGALAAALERISAVAPGGPARQSSGRLLAFLGAKGGVGATTLACNVASALGKPGERGVLLADLDLEAGNVGFAMKASSPYSILDACRSLSRLDVHYWKGLVSNGLTDLNVLSAPRDLQQVETPQPVEIRQVLSFARTLYGYNVADMASRLNNWSLAVLEDVDQTFLVTTSDLPSLHQAKRAIHTLAQAGHPPERLNLVVNRASRQDEVSPEDVERNLDVPLFWCFPNDVKSVMSFYLQGRAVSAKSDLGKSIEQFVTRILE